MPTSLIPFHLFWILQLRQTCVLYDCCPFSFTRIQKPFKRFHQLRIWWNFSVQQLLMVRFQEARYTFDDQISASSIRQDFSFTLYSVYTNSSEAPMQFAVVFTQFRSSQLVSKDFIRRLWYLAWAFTCPFLVDANFSCLRSHLAAEIAI